VQTPTSPRRRGRPSGSEGAELLAVAREQFISHGFRKTTMDAIAARARISKQSLYGAYPSKDALYAAVVRDWVDRGYDAPDIRDGLRRLAGVLQAGILSPPVLQMRTLVAAEADTFPGVAADYVTRSWDRNTDLLAETLSALSRRGTLAIDHARVAAEQFVWMVIGAPLNRLTLHGTAPGHTGRQLHHIADQAVTTFLSRYGPDAPRSGRRAP
jgi:TetR/AcrR family transcriptional regulator, mexJK operon transcriptional repressor